MDEKKYTSKQLMEHFRVSRYSLYRAQKEGLLVPERRGRENFYSEADVKRYMERSDKRKKK